MQHCCSVRPELERPCTDQFPLDYSVSQFLVITTDTIPENASMLRRSSFQVHRSRYVVLPWVGSHIVTPHIRLGSALFFCGRVWPPGVLSPNSCNHDSRLYFIPLAILSVQLGSLCAIMTERHMVTTSAWQIMRTVQWCLVYRQHHVAHGMWHARRAFRWSGALM